MTSEPPPSLTHPPAKKQTNKQTNDGLFFFRSFVGKNPRHTYLIHLYLAYLASYSITVYMIPHLFV